MEDYKQIVERKADELFASLEPRTDAADMQRVKDAFLLANEAHAPQKRKSGEPYILHPLAVAAIVGNDLRLGPNMVIAALLHDVVEDTPVTLDDIKLRFGSDVAKLVGVVTKKKKNTYRYSKQIDNFRQLLESVHADIRALLIKLADRLHNMRTLDSMAPGKQMKIAGETDYFYAPLANRLGLYHIKTELENLSFKYRCPADYNKIQAQLNTYRESNLNAIEAFTSKINRVLRERGVTAHTQVRYRKPSSVWRKMKSQDCDFGHVEGKHYVRIIFPASADHQAEKTTALNIYSVLTDYFKERPGSTTNYIDAPKENGYESFHVKLLSEQGSWQEIHIASERMIRDSRIGKSGEVNDPQIHAWLDKFRRVIEDVASHDKQMDFLDSVATSFYNDDIMVFTPKGKEIILPKNASAIDFAYEIHSDVGLHALYARINGRLCSMKTILHRGDCVEIGTSPNATPDPGWLDYASTYKALRSLRSYFASLPELPYHRCPQCHPLPGEEVIGFRERDNKITIHTPNCPVAIRAASRHGDSICEVNFTENKNFSYSTSIKITGVDRYHLLSDIIHCITGVLKLEMQNVSSETVDNIATTTVQFRIHSFHELDSAIEGIKAIEGVDEVTRIAIT